MKKCPNGKVLNPKTGRCIKEKSKQIKTNKQCLDGKVLNPKTGRCIKEKSKQTKTNIKKKKDEINLLVDKFISHDDVKESLLELSQRTNFAFLFSLIQQKYETTCIMDIQNFIDPIRLASSPEINYKQIFEIKVLLKREENEMHIDKIDIPPNFKQLVDKCKKNKTHFLIIPYANLDTMGHHQNVLIYDLQADIIEHFEPHGSLESLGDNYVTYLNTYNTSFLTKIFRYVLQNNNVKYYPPSTICPIPGPQARENIYEAFDIEPTDPFGFCVIWSMWYVDLRLANPHVDRTNLIQQAMQTMINNDISFKKFIRTYANNLVKYAKYIEKEFTVDKIKITRKKLISLLKNKDLINKIPNEKVIIVDNLDQEIKLDIFDWLNNEYNKLFQKIIKKCRFNNNIKCQ